MKTTFYAILGLVLALIVYILYNIFGKKKDTPIEKPQEKTQKYYQNGYEDIFGGFENVDAIKTYLNSFPSVSAAMQRFLQDGYLSENEKVMSLHFLNATLNDKNIDQAAYQKWYDTYKNQIDIIKERPSRLEEFQMYFEIDIKKRLMASEYYITLSKEKMLILT